MTIIQKLRLRGFKSFAKPTEIPFSEDFSIVLGPNGSGKSNIGDAICFVLGKISAKSLRAEKSANLIFNGGKKGSPMKEAQVDIFFDNSKKEFSLTEQTVKISRIIRRSGTSIYKINDQKRTREQIIDLLNTANINPDGHNIILQGDIIRFMEMHPDDRRELIEETAGISIYEDKKLKSLNELQRVEEKLNNANLILKEREIYLRELKRDRDQALRFKELETQIKSNTATYLNLQINEKQEKKAEIESRINKYKSELKKITDKISFVKSDITSKKEKIEEVNKEIEEEGEISQLKLRESIGELKTLIIKDTSRLETCLYEIKKIESRKSQLRENLEDVENTIKDLEKTKVELQEKDKQLANSDDELSKDISKLKEKYGLKDLSKIELQINIDIKTLEKSILELKEIISKIKIPELKKTLENLNEHIYSLDKNISGIKKETPEIEDKTRLFKFEQKKSEIRDNLIQIKIELKNIDVQLENIHLPEKDSTFKILKEHDKELSEFQKEIIELEKRIKKDKEDLQKEESKEKKFYSDYKNLFQKRNKINEELQKREFLITSQDRSIREIENKINDTFIIKAKITTEIEALEKEFEPFKGSQLRKGMSIENLKYEISKFERAKNELGSVNLRALEVYDSIKEEYQLLLSKVDKLRVEKEDVLKMIEEIDSKKKDIFMKTFNILDSNFRKIFSSLTEKGEAFLELQNKEKPFEAGLDIRVRWLGNKLLDIKSLSGGEKTLAALAFIFAIQEYQPASFYLLDEVDAALDKRNSEMLSKLLAKYAQKAQYILISHNDSIISEANKIYGVSMQQDGISKVVSLKI